MSRPTSFYAEQESIEMPFKLAGISEGGRDTEHFKASVVSEEDGDPISRCCHLASQEGATASLKRAVRQVPPGSTQVAPGARIRSAVLKLSK